MHLAKMALRRRACAGGHVTGGDRGGGGGVAVKDLKGPDKHNVILGLSI